MLTAIVDVMRRVYERGWITTRDGNISMRKREGKYLYITPSGWRKTIVRPEHVVRLEIVNDPGVKEKSERTGAYPMTMTPDQFAIFIRTEADRWSKVLKETNIKFD